MEGIAGRVLRFDWAVLDRLLPYCDRSLELAMMK